MANAKRSAGARVERVLIVGGGMAGLSLAIALRQRGLSAEIVERADEGAGTGAGLYLVGLGTRALGALGLADAALREAYLNRTQTFRNHRGARLAELDVEAYWASCGPCREPGSRTKLSETGSGRANNCMNQAMR